jgi:SAM-dependent methyltransferase
MSQSDSSNSDDYYERVRVLLEDSYVAADERGDIYGGSGSSGDAANWEAKRRVLSRAFDRPGDWLDVGCANGLLMETLSAWVGERGYRIEPYGLDISDRIVRRARLRLPQWAARIWTGNVMTFAPPILFDYVTVLIDAVPIESRAAMLTRIAQLYLKPGGRLILSCYRPGGFLLGPKAFDAESAAAILRDAGFEPIGDAEVIDPATGAPKVRVAWTDIVERV